MKQQQTTQNRKQPYSINTVKTKQTNTGGAQIISQIRVHKSNYIRIKEQNKRISSHNQHNQGTIRTPNKFTPRNNK